MAERERYGALRRARAGGAGRRLADDPSARCRMAARWSPPTRSPKPRTPTLVRLLAAAGRYPEAERHYAWARELLRREVALPDGGALDEAIRSVRQLQRHAAATPPRAGLPPQPAPA